MNMGCDGGILPNALKYATDKEIVSREDYPYTMRLGECKDLTGIRGVKLNYTYDLYPNEVDQLKAALHYGPVAISADAENAYFRDYGGGILTEPNGCTTQVGHAMLAVGYGYNPYTGDFLIIKNSWGTSWGENGYVRIALT